LQISVDFRIFLLVLGEIIESSGYLIKKSVAKFQIKNVTAHSGDQKVMVFNSLFHH
jgi:hypothetical protein